ncbi:transmembrane protein 176B-like [Toxotes jaculatrix]|uniref:transmembrane protein 176B-like n=1 Tax=Toxotes jaculatrix TaxID=941984 RepID=UPI001B3AF94C|nr:transmembrane protein 176B-like [Toxotes jaculatrix]
MSVSVTKADGVTVITLTSDPRSPWPPLYQILKALCYNPLCCTVSQHLRRVQGMSQSVLATLHIMVGLLNIGFGGIDLAFDPFSGFPFWLGALFMVFGIMCILSEKYPSPCLVTLNVVLNLAGVIFAIAAIVLYSISIASTWLWWSCSYDYYGEWTTSSPFPAKEFMKERCLQGQELVLMFQTSLNAVMIVLSALELCVTISSAVLGIKALRSSAKGEKQSTGDSELYKPLLEEVTTKQP